MSVNDVNRLSLVSTFEGGYLASVFQAVLPSGSQLVIDQSPCDLCQQALPGRADLATCAVGASGSITVQATLPPFSVPLVARLGNQGAVFASFSEPTYANNVSNHQDVVSTILGDVNRDGLVNVSDVLYLQNYLMASGPPPMGPGNIHWGGLVNDLDMTVWAGAGMSQKTWFGNVYYCDPEEFWRRPYAVTFDWWFESCPPDAEHEEPFIPIDDRNNNERIDIPPYTFAPGAQINILVYGKAVIADALDVTCGWWGPPCTNLRQDFALAAINAHE